MTAPPEQSLRAWVEYLRDLGVYDLYRRDPTSAPLPEEALERLQSGMRLREQAQGAAAQTKSTPVAPAPTRLGEAPVSQAQGSSASRTGVPVPRPVTAASHDQELSEQGTQRLPPELAAPMPKPNPLETLLPAAALTPPGERGEALARLRAEIGDCTRCPLAYAGRHTIVYGEGDPNAQLMFIGEGPGADEDETGRPFIGKAGQLLTNMITAMGLAREQVYIANIVKCRPPGNRAPEFVEATTCSQFLLRQIDIVRPTVIVALGATAATYVLGVRQSLASLRDQWFSCRGAKVAVTYHPAFLLRDPRQKPEAWKDLQRVMKELGLRPPARSS